MWWRFEVAPERRSQFEEKFQCPTLQPSTLDASPARWIISSWRWEGGIRVPLIVRWPSRLGAGVVSVQQTIHMDLAATILAAAGLDPDAKLDGVNLIPILTGGAPAFDRTFFWRLSFPGREQKAVRRGRWKLIEDGNTPLLFDLEEDISERHDHRYAQPSLVMELRAALGAWEKELPPQAR
jgi:arylsulfatase A-like enzyme